MDNFISVTEIKIKSLLSTLGWNYEAFLNNKETFKECPNNPQHRIPSKKLEDHLKTCNETEEPTLSLWAENGSSVKFTSSLQDEILKESLAIEPKGRPVPSTSNELMETFSTQERLSLYDYAVANTKSRKPNFRELMFPNDIIPEETKKMMTPMELAAAERDAKRRRPTYKKVHTNRKTHTEVIREVIESQMSSTFGVDTNEPSEEKRRERQNTSSESDRRHNRYNEHEREYKHHGDDRRRYHNDRSGNSSDSYHRGYSNERRHQDHTGYRNARGHHDHTGYRNERSHHDHTGYRNERSHHDHTGYRNERSHHDLGSHRKERSHQDQTGYRRENNHHDHSGYRNHDRSVSINEGSRRNKDNENHSQQDSLIQKHDCEENDNVTTSRIETEMDTDLLRNPDNVGETRKRKRKKEHKKKKKKKHKKSKKRSDSSSSSD